MARLDRSEKGFPDDPVLALRARELLADVRQLVSAEQWRDAAPRSAALVQVAPNLAEAHELMGIVAMRTGAAKIAETCFERAVKIGPATASRLLHWAKALHAQGEDAAAEKLLQRALLIRPDDPAILSDLGDAQLSQNRPADALKSFRRVLRKQPGSRYAAHMISALTQDGTPDQGYVERLFDDYADIFDTHLTETLSYRVPAALAGMVRQRERTLTDILDIGCGTGLVAAAFAGSFSAIDGMDLAPRMVEKARERGLYRHLATGDATEVLRTDPAFAGLYDLCIAADVFIYVGAIDRLLAAMVERLSPDGMLAFSIETSQDKDVEIRASGRFAHSQAYIARLASEHGLTVQEHASHDIRLEDGRPIPGALYLLGRG